MIKVLRCRELMPGCPAVFRADTEEALLARYAEHVAEAHGVAFTADLARLASRAIRVEDIPATA